MKLPDFEFVRNIPTVGPRLHEVFTTLQDQVNILEQQANISSTQPIQPPPNVNAVRAQGNDGHLQISVTDQNVGISRGINYFAEVADNPHFTNPRIIPMGPSRDWHRFVGNGTWHVRGYSAYPNGPASDKVYHGTQVQPTPVVTGGDIPPPNPVPSQGAGTGSPGQGGYGPGPTQVRTSVGAFNWQAQGPAVTGFSGSTPAGLNALGGGSGPSPSVPTRVTIRDTRANRLGGAYPAARYPNGIVYQESDTHWEYITGGPVNPNAWVYQSGVFVGSDTSAPPSDVPTGLGANDAGALYKNTFWGRTWIWLGSQWDYFDGGTIPGATAAFITAPIYGQWGISDGSAYTGVGPLLTAISVVSLPFYTTGTEPVFITGGPVTSGVATSPTWNGSPITDDESSHTHTVAGELTVAGFTTGTDFVDSQTTSPGTPHHHTLSDANAKLNPPSRLNGGLPLHTVALWYVRL